MTPDERMAQAVERLDYWLADYAKREDPIETALDDLSGFFELLEDIANGECAQGKTDCLDCIKNNITATGETLSRLRELWEARA